MIHGATLRSYQEEAKELMIGNGRVLLSLTMGAGKTLTSIAAIEELVDNGVVQNGLVFVPSALKYQWQDAIKEFTGVTALVIDGTAPKRAKLYKHMPRYRYTILGYTAVEYDWKIVRDLDYDFIIVDEVTALKSFEAMRSRRIKFLGKRVDIKYGLTGQPIENKPEELFSIMEFVDPEVLGDYRVFDQAFIVRNMRGVAVRFRNLPRIKKLLEPCFYRKTRKDIEDEFPRVITSMLPISLSAKERGLYRRAADYTLAALRKAKDTFGGSFDVHAHYGRADGGSAMAQQLRGQIMSGMLAMRLICNDPGLLRDSALLYEKGKGEGSALASQWLHAGLLDGIPSSSTKRTVTAERLNAILDEDKANKIVVFSAFKGMIRRVQEDMSHVGSVQFTGDMNAIKKRDAQRKFKADPDCRLFLSSDAGGYGVDLPNANYLISLDLPWSTGKKEQRDARIIRISSQWEHVNIMAHLIADSDSIEMWMWQLLGAKEGVSAAFLDGKYDTKGSFTPTLDSLTSFLEGGS